MFKIIKSIAIKHDYFDIMIKKYNIWMNFY